MVGIGCPPGSGSLSKASECRMKAAEVCFHSSEIMLCDIVGPVSTYFEVSYCHLNPKSGLRIPKGDVVLFH
jgi:hypothetical protein